MNRLLQILLISTFLPTCWLLMQVVHETGHVLGAWATGGTVAKVVLHPWAISRTDVSGSVHPLVVVWSGPLVGTLLPLGVLALWQMLRLPLAYLTRFFAGACLVANGAYLGIGSFERIGDAGDLLGLGTPIAALWGFGVVAFPLGIALWHGLGPHFGLGSARGVVERRAVWASSLLLGLLLVLELLLSTSA